MVAGLTSRASLRFLALLSRSSGILLESAFGAAAPFAEEVFVGCEDVVVSAIIVHQRKAMCWG